MYTYTAQDARKRFGEVLDLVKYHGTSVTITRAGKPIVTIIPHIAPTTSDAPLASYAGSWSDDFAESVSTKMREYRKGFKLSR